MGTIALRNVSGEPLDGTAYLFGRTVGADEVIDLDAEVVDRYPDAVVLDIAGMGQPLAFPTSRWAVEGGDTETVREVLARVGPDAAAAAAAAKTERDTSRGGQNRTTLLKALDRIAAGGATAADLPDGLLPEGAVLADGTVRPHGLLGDFSPATATAENPTGALDTATADAVDRTVDPPDPGAGQPPGQPTTTTDGEV